MATLASTGEVVADDAVCASLPCGSDVIAVSGGVAGGAGVVSFNLHQLGLGYGESGTVHGSGDGQVVKTCSRELHGEAGAGAGNNCVSGVGGNRVGHASHVGDGGGGHGNAFTRVDVGVAHSEVRLHNRNLGEGYGHGQLTSDGSHVLGEAVASVEGRQGSAVQSTNHVVGVRHRGNPDLGARLNVGHVAHGHGADRVVMVIETLQGDLAAGHLGDVDGAKVLLEVDNQRLAVFDRGARLNGELTTSKAAGHVRAVQDDGGDGVSGVRSNGELLALDEDRSVVDFVVADVGARLGNRFQAASDGTHAATDLRRDGPCAGECRDCEQEGGC